MVSGIYEDCGIRLKKIRETGRDVLRLIIPDKHNRFPEDENYMEPYRLQISFPPSTMWNQHIKHVDYGMKSTPSFVRMYFFGDGIFSSSICAIIRCPIASSKTPVSSTPKHVVRFAWLSYTEKIVIPKFLSFHRKYSDFMKNIGITKCLGYLKPASLRNVSSSVSSQIGFSSGTAISAVALLIASRFISVSAYA